MADAKHTPGPWVIIPAVPHEEFEGAFAAFAGIEGSDGSPVCVFGDAAGSGTMFENQADHHLIAAAPELLAALQNLMTPFGADIERRAPALYENMRAAIAKATGQDGAA